MPRGSTPTRSDSWSPSPVRSLSGGGVGTRRVILPSVVREVTPRKRSRTRSRSPLERGRDREWRYERRSPSPERKVRYPSPSPPPRRGGERSVQLTRSPSPRRRSPPSPRRRSPPPRPRRRSLSPKPLRSERSVRVTRSPSPAHFFPEHRNRTVGVFGLSAFTSEVDLEREFGRFGPIRHVDLVRDNFRNSRRFAFILFRYQEDADKAVRVMDGSILDGFKVRLDYSYSGGPRSKTPGVYLGHDRNRSEEYGRSRRRRSCSPTPNGTTFRYTHDRHRPY